eukprot:3349572-Alexandrium_andersonii.AAC.1
MRAAQGYARRLLLRGLATGGVSEAVRGAAMPVATPVLQEAPSEPFYLKPSVGSWLRPVPTR